MKKQNYILLRLEENNMQVVKEFSGIKIKSGLKLMMKKKSRD